MRSTALPSAPSLIDKESAGNQLTWCSYFPLGVCVSSINNTLRCPSSSNDYIWPALSENVVGPVHAQKKSTDGSGEAAGFLELQPYRRCVGRGIMQYLWESSLKAVDRHTQHIYLQLRKYHHQVSTWLCTGCLVKLFPSFDWSKNVIMIVS